MSLLEAKYQVNLNRRICVLKESLPVEQYAGEVTSLKYDTASSLRGRCPVHGGDNPTSFSVRSDTGRAHCFSCNFDGDVLDLFMAVEDYGEDEIGLAIVALAERFGIELPARPRSWFEKNTRQASVREAIRREKVEVLRRRLFKFTILPLIRDVTPPEDHDAEVSEAWKSFQGVPVEKLLNDFEERRRA